MPDRLSRQTLELHAGGSDGGGTLATAVCAAFVVLQHAQSFRRLLWSRLAIIVAAAWLLEALAVVPKVALAMSMVLCGGIGGASLMWEWRSQKRLRNLLSRSTKP